MDQVERIDQVAQTTLRQTQWLAPDLRISLELLRLPKFELFAYVGQMLMENPLLEEEGVDGEPEPELQEDVVGDYEGLISDTADPMALLANPPQTLQAYVLEQIGFLKITSSMRQLLSFLAESLTPQGDLSVPEAELETLFGKKRAAEALRIFRGLEPAGIGGYGIADRLLFQWWRQGGKPGDLVSVIIANHLEDVATSHLGRIAKLLDTSLEAVRQAVDQLKGLDPKPARIFASGQADKGLLIEGAIDVQDERITVRVYDILGKRRLTLNRDYMSERYRQDQEAREFIQEKRKQAEELLQALVRRYSTMERLLLHLATVQRDYFLQGSLHLRPYTRLEAAESLGLHESTISRAVNEKWIETPYGVRPLSFFFPSKVRSHKGVTSSERVRTELLALVQKEDRRKPLSDQQIVQALKEHGVTVARRTIAKYRQELGILDSSLRKSR